MSKLRKLWCARCRSGPYQNMKGLRIHTTQVHGDDAEARHVPEDACCAGLTDTTAHGHLYCVDCGTILSYADDREVSA